MKTNGFHPLKEREEKHLYVVSQNKTQLCAFPKRHTPGIQRGCRSWDSSPLTLCAVLFDMPLHGGIWFVTVHLLALQEAQSLSCDFSVPVLESAISPRKINTNDLMHK